MGSEALGWAGQGLLFVPTGCVSDGGGGAEAAAGEGPEARAEAGARCGIHLHLDDCNAPPPPPPPPPPSSTIPRADADDDVLVLTAAEERLLRFAVNVQSPKRLRRCWFWHRKRSVRRVQR